MRPLFLPVLLLIPAIASAQTVIGDVVASDASVRGAVQLAGSGTRVLSGSSVNAGKGAATLRLARGGEVRVCPQTELSVAAAANGRDLALGFGTGAIELDYQLGSSSDVLHTPDFKLQLAGPGRFRLAIGSNAHGDACVKPFAGNSTSLIVTELMGDGVYQVQPNETVTFLGGKVAGNKHDSLEPCGCPAPPPVQKAQAPAPAPEPAAPRIADPLPSTATAPVLAASVTQPVPGNAASQPHVEVDAPMVFRAPGLPREPDPPVLDRFGAPRTLPAPISLERTAAPPAEPQQKHWFGKVRAFFAAVFK